MNAIVNRNRLAPAFLAIVAAILGTVFAAAPAAAADPDQGPGGPILVISGDSNPFGRFYAEILRNEGLNEFDVTDLGDVTQPMLHAHDVVVLGETPLTPAEATMLSDWVQDGGNLIAMRPDDDLAGLLGLTGAGTTLSDAYLEVDDSTPPGEGIVGEPIQFHGTADRYSLSGATEIATLYSDATTATTNPAVTSRSVGPNGGEAAAFTYDLARSVVYTRQGNPAWAGQDRDGVGPVRSNDLFYGDAAGDPQPDWVDLDKVEIPQADEQQRLLANMIGQMNLDRSPLPRFWYFPNGEKAAIVMTGDDHGSGGTAGRFNLEQAQSTPGCSVADWQCVRSTSYVYPGTPLTDAQAAGYEADGFEVALHPNTGCASLNAGDYDNLLTSQLNDFAAAFPSVSDPVTSRNHCIAWTDWTTTPEVELDHGIRLDANYYYWPQSWLQDRPGMFTGSGMPMRFAKTDGSMIDIYQAATQMTDESGQSFPATSDALLDRALGPEGYYGAFTANMHTDSALHPGWTAIVGSAQSRGVPVISARQLLEWTDGRNESSFGSVDFSSGVLSFTVSPGAGADGLQGMVPTQSAAGTLAGVERNGNPVATTTETIKGVEYAFFAAGSGSYEATYEADTTAPSISSVAAVAGPGGTATVTWQTDEPADSRVDYGTSPGSLGSSESEGAPVTSHSVELTGLAPGTTYHFRVTSEDGAGNSATSPEPPTAPATFSTPSASLTDTTTGDFGGGAHTGVHVTNDAGGEVILKPEVAEEFGGSALPASFGFSGDWGPGGAATVAGGALDLNGAYAGTTNLYGSGRSLEFVATFLASTPFTHVGFGVDYNNDPHWQMFSVKNDGNLYARTNNGGPETLLPASLLGSPHRYRIEWGAADVRYYVDGALVATHNVGFGATQLRPLASEFNAGGGSLSVDWLRMTPYAGSGTFTSRVLDAGDVVEWDGLSWNADVPAGTSVALSVRTGDTPTPDGTWSSFAPIAASGDDVPGSSRYAQYRAEFTSSDPEQTAVLRDVTLDYHANPVAVDDAETVDEDSGPNAFDVRANDTDADGGTKQVTAVTQGGHGTVAITNGGDDLTYEPDPNYCNTDPAGPGSGPDDAFTYTLNGGSTATVSVEVTCLPEAGGDTTDPEIEIRDPYEAGRYSIEADPKPELHADYECDDADSGIASCVGTVADGALFDRSSPGTKTFTVTATDNAGNTATESVTYRVFHFRDFMLDDDPLAYYRMGDAAGSQTMHAEVGPDGEYKNGQSSGPFGISGDGDRARLFTGADGYGYANNITAPRSYTLNAFFKLDDSGPAMILQHGSAGAIWHSGGMVRFRPVDWLGVELDSGAGSVTPGVWHQVAATYKWVPDPQNPQLGTGTARLYLDGEHVDVRTADRQTSGTSTFYVAYGDKAPWLRGLVDEVAYYPTALSHTHLHEIWLADPPPPAEAQTGGSGSGGTGGGGSGEPAGGGSGETPAPSTGGGSGGSGSAGGSGGSGGSAPATEPEVPLPDEGPGESGGSSEGAGIELGAASAKGKWLTVEVSCADDCAGKLSARKGKRKLGKAKFDLAAGESEFVDLKLKKKARKAVKRGGRIEVTVEGDDGERTEKLRLKRR